MNANAPVIRRAAPACSAVVARSPTARAPAARPAGAELTAASRPTWADAERRRARSARAAARSEASPARRDGRGRPGDDGAGGQGFEQLREIVRIVLAVAVAEDQHLPPRQPACVGNRTAVALPPRGWSEADAPMRALGDLGHDCSSAVGRAVLR